MNVVSFPVPILVSMSPFTYADRTLSAVARLRSFAAGCYDLDCRSRVCRISGVLIPHGSVCSSSGSWCYDFRHRATRTRQSPHPGTEPIEIQIYDRCRIGREKLRKQQAAHDGVAEWLARLRTIARGEHQRNPAEQGSHGGHEDRAETQSELDAAYSRKR